MGDGLLAPASACRRGGRCEEEPGTDMRSKTWTRAAIALALCLLASCSATDPSKNAADAAVDEPRFTSAELMEEPVHNKPKPAVLTGEGSMARASTKVTLTPYQQHVEIGQKMKVGAKYIAEHKAKKEKAAKEKANKEK